MVKSSNMSQSLKLIFACQNHLKPRLHTHFLMEDIAFGRWFELLLEPSHCCFTRSATDGIWHAAMLPLWCFNSDGCSFQNIWCILIPKILLPNIDQTFVRSLRNAESCGWYSHIPRSDPSMRPRVNGSSTPWNSWSRPTYKGEENDGLFTRQFVWVWVKIINLLGKMELDVSMQTLSSLVFLWIHQYPSFEPYLRGLFINWWWYIYIYLYIYIYIYINYWKVHLHFSILKIIPIQSSPHPCSNWKLPSVFPSSKSTWTGEMNISGNQSSNPWLMAGSR